MEAENRVNSYMYFDSFESRDDDIFIVTFPKAGTTWMQMILYQMLTDGSMDFKHIYEVSPWLTNQSINGTDTEKINALKSPRIIKSHDVYSKFDPGSKNKFVFVYRNGLDSVVSLNHHRRNYNNPDESLQETIDAYFKPDSPYNWFIFNEEWARNKHGLDVINIDYHDLVNDFDSVLSKLADFLRVSLDEQKINRIKERASFSFMKKHEDKFGEQPKDKRVYNQFIRKGIEGEGLKGLKEIQKQSFESDYQKVMVSYQKILKT